jgi:hypothetical protein
MTVEPKQPKDTNGVILYRITAIEGQLIDFRSEVRSGLEDLRQEVVELKLARARIEWAERVAWSALAGIRGLLLVAILWAISQARP